MIIVLSLGGSLMNTEQGINQNYLEEIKKIIEKSPNKFGIVTGGGYAARQYVREVKSRQGNEFEADEAAIEATQENAKVLIKTLGKSAYPKVPKDFKEAKKASEKYKVIVMGGLLPGMTTDSDAVLLTECLEANKLINISNVDGVYNKDPRKDPTAKKYHFLTHEELINLAFEADKRTAGTHFVFDLLACKLAARSKIELHFVNGKDLGSVRNAVEGKEHNGTIVR